MTIDRRDALAGIVAMFGASLFAPIARAAAGRRVRRCSPRGSAR